MGKISANIQEQGYQKIVMIVDIMNTNKLY